MKLAVISSQTDPETVFNALRLTGYSLKQGDTVKSFLAGRGVELDQITDAKFDVQKLSKEVLDSGGVLLASGTCLKLRGSEICPLSTLKDMYETVRDADKVVTF